MKQYYRKITKDNTEIEKGIYDLSTEKEEATPPATSRIKIKKMQKLPVHDRVEKSCKRRDNAFQPAPSYKSKV